MSKRLGAVIVFADGVSKPEAEWFLKDLENKGLIDGLERQQVDREGGKAGTTVHEFNPDHGVPAWYIP